MIATRWLMFFKVKKQQECSVFPCFSPSPRYLIDQIRQSSLASTKGFPFVQIWGPYRKVK